MMQLQINGKQKKRLWLTKSHYSIGNSANCDIRVADQAVRELHAHLVMDGDIPSLVREEDAAVKLNGVPLEMESRLLHGDRIRVGNTELQILDSRQAGDFQKADEPPLGWELQGMNTALSGKHFNVEGVVVVGRANECDIHLAEAHLSRRHAQLSVTADGLEVEDLDSANGTFVNGRRVSKAKLKSGDELCFDTLRFRVIHTATTDETNKTLVRPSAAYAGVAQEHRGAAAIELDSHLEESGNPGAGNVDDDHKGSEHPHAAAAESGDGAVNAQLNTQSNTGSDTQSNTQSSMGSANDPSNVPHGSSGEEELPEETDSDPEPAVPTAIEIQLETLRRQREERRDLAGASSIQPVGTIMEGGRLALMMALAALAGIIWGAMSFFDPSFFSAPTSLVGNSIK